MADSTTTPADTFTPGTGVAPQGNCPGCPQCPPPRCPHCGHPAHQPPRKAWPPYRYPWIGDPAQPPYTVTWGPDGQTQQGHGSFPVQGY